MKKTVFLLFLLFLFLVFPFPSALADDWVTPSAVHSAHAYYGSYVPENTIDDILTSKWAYYAWDGLAWIIFDVGSSQEITKVRAYYTSSGWNDAKVYVSDDPENFGEAVWQGDLGSYYGEWIESGTFSKVGRYIKVAAQLFDDMTGYMYEFNFWKIEGVTQYELNLNSLPFQNVNFTLNGTTYQTNYTDILDESYYNITFPSVWVNNSITYVFKNWSDGNTNPSRIINLNANTTLTVTYVLPSKIPVLFVGACVIGGLIGFVFILSRRKKR